MPNKPTKIFLVNDHDRALQYLHQSIGRKILPLENITLVHFDAHPDFVINDEISPENIENPKKPDSKTQSNLYDKVSIESWIVPLILAGHVNHLVWIKNFYCDQFSVGDYTLTLGYEKASGKIRTDLYENYFLADGKCCLQGDLRPENSQQIRFSVRDLGQLNDVTLASDKIILDIDLDVFSTYDPFRVLLGEDNFKVLTEIFPYDVFKEAETLTALKEKRDFAKILQQQEVYCSEMENIIRQLETTWTSGTVNEKTDTLAEFCQNCQARDVDFETVISAAESLILPHRLSTESEIETFMEQFLQDLESLPEPAVVTVARSSEDEYCPRDQVLDIENLALTALKRAFDRITFTRVEDPEL